ncbi:palmitoyltransferase ZDHHC2/15/20 [Geosmithia morbida]|uniref:Palmitoyltransferase n=1 Tax=Geosmithia morbida TaxID=1094350 RepID=A0A9P4YQG6_9HYPO|nr:palmitoyltransferase ZDHHC2/15/20 [Geosmithia morbida]KAF4120687.1 palmitoyltransferase ZDHHC2/15/20 [Geosmithia morbida]
MMTARRCARRMERVCCTTAKYMPLGFVYGLTSWGMWVVAKVGLAGSAKQPWLGKWSTAFGLLLYVLLNWSYTTAVFTPPGSTTDDNGYGLLPTEASGAENGATSYTVKSNGEFRYCKKCQARKPDRAHHCSTCRRCVLKMDHHCPWLATCVGLRNYKAFLLFLIYTSVFCMYAAVVAGTWVWSELLDSAEYIDSLAPVNFVMAAVVGGIISIVVGAFTSWHIMLACRGQTTIECLEKTRYRSPLQRAYRQAHDPANRMAPAARQLVDFHANAIPGVTRPEEGEEGRSSFQRQEQSPYEAGPETGTRMSYADMERERSRRRYEEYLDEQDSDKLPNVFDHGWRANLRHLFGPTPLLWFVPVCNTSGDGWYWEASPRWLEARDRLRAEREQQRLREVNAGWGPSYDDDDVGNDVDDDSVARVNGARPSNGSTKADRILGRDPNLYADRTQDAVPMKRLSSGPHRHRYRTVDDELAEIDGVDGDEAEHAAAMNVVTNGAWGKGGASGVLRNQGQGQQQRRSPPAAGVQVRRYQDDGVD